MVPSGPFYAVCALYLMGRVNLSYKDALKEIKAKKEAGEPIK